ncbi:MAG: DUF4258 domain-containing protein [Verrucomicrobia bacterium]|nr:DUF4258 domain-containing protein [Verrucomicrobiota bacterium]MDE3046831.1 DUF4258 domain-containing protein [Verrucomicrobiota bacterium]
MSLKRPSKITDVLKIAKACIDNGNYRPTFHAECRQYERDITLIDALHVIETGYRVPSRDEYKEEFNAWNYAIEGVTLQDDKTRVIISFDEDLMLIITVINLVKR